MSKRPGETDGASPGTRGDQPIVDADLEHRRKALDAAIAARRVEPVEKEGGGGTGGLSGIGNALRLSSEFIAGIVVGAGIGWIIDRFAGTSPFGLIVFLLLGFGAGVLNALRSAGLVADFGANKPDGGERKD